MDADRDVDLAMSFLRSEIGEDVHEGDKMVEVLRDQDRFLPIANVARIMKKAIPRTGKIAKDGRECVQECVSEFISFITSEASDRCHQEKRKTINGEDILWAMNALGFENYVDPLKIYLTKYREATKGEKTSEDPLGGAYEVDYSNNLTNTFTTDHVNQSELVCTYGANGQVTQQFTLG